MKLPRCTNDSGAALEYFYMAKTAACHIYFPNCIKTSAKNLKMLILHWKIILTAVCNPFGFGTFRVNCYEWLNTRFIMNMPMFASMHIKIIPKESGWCQKPMAGVDVLEKRGNKATLYQETCWNHAWSRTVSRLLSGSAFAWSLVVMNRKVHSAEFR